MTSSLSSGSSALASGLHGAPSSTTAQGGGQTAGEVSLLLGAADNVFKQEGETAYLASKRNIKQRLVAFYMYHPEVRKPFCASHLVTASSEVRSCFSNQITTVNNNVVYVFNHPKLRKLFCASHLITEFYSPTGLYQAKNIVQKMLVARVF